MSADLYPLQMLLVKLAGWINRHQQQVIEYLLEENRVQKEQVKGRRPRLTDDQRRRLATKGQRLGRRVLTRVATIAPCHVRRAFGRRSGSRWGLRVPPLEHRGADIWIRRAVKHPRTGLR